MTAPQTTDVLSLPNGWFAVCWSKDLEVGEVKRLHCFDRELVLYRTREGRPALLDAYCPHLGANIAVGGRVIGETIRCPFHGWRFDGSGACVEIPHCGSIPPAARLRGWDVVERNRMIFAWHHTEQKPPDWEVPTIDVIGHPDWTEPRLVDIEVAVHLQELAENNNDPAHFEFVHGTPDMPPSEIEYGEDGRFYRMSSKGKRETPQGTFETTLVRETFGLGMGKVWSEGIPGVGTMLFSATTPIDAGHSTMRWLLTVTKNVADLVGEDFMTGIVQGVQQDVPIWENKIHRATPVLCETDGFIAEFRRWTRQFYSD
jgi:phenylpropionate dioxygenase-like ring-hydroxylating dioxygenase large terminal subunit